MATQPQIDMAGALKATNNEWLEALESPEERKELAALIKKTSPEKAAETWILEAYRAPRRGMKDSGRPDRAVPDGSSLFSRLKEEFDKFICGHKDYDKERKRVIDALKKGRMVMVSALAGVLAQTLAVTAAVLAPAIVALLIAMSRMGQSAYCKTVNLKKIRKN